MALLALRWLAILPSQGGAFSLEDSAKLPSLLWMAPILNPGGYSSEALSYADALQKAYRSSGQKGDFGLRQFAEQTNRNFVRGLPKGLGSRISKMLTRGKRRTPWDVVVCHATPDVWHEDGAFSWGRVEPCPPVGTKHSIGRSMYETDALPETWVPRLNRMDEVWVPSHFGLEHFVSSGVQRNKIAVVPEAVDTDLFDPAAHEALELGGTEGLYRFLSVFKWEKRKGWDILLRAYFQEFSAVDDVILVIKTQAFHSDDDFHNKVLAEISKAQEAGGAPDQPARYKLLSEDLTLKDLPRLYQAADAFVLPSRGEGWGRPHVEAMAMSLPVIATNWSGSTDFLSADIALPLPIDGLAKAEGAVGRWAEPSSEALRRLMRWAQQHPGEAKKLGEAARRRMVEDFSPERVVSRYVLPLLRRFSDGGRTQERSEL